ncbi:hypothetical protein Tco_0749715 [Tanacetum coccineum]|uniref:Uncharacterized protein n=1 Tax=Tanacetum coccineum TaxID=301880 RepID=A0ABQ4YZA0_9ASTR
MVSQKMSYIKWCLLKITLQAPFLNVQMMSVHISSGLVLHQMTSDHNRSELGIQDHSNEQSSSKLVPKVVVRLGINPMIQPEPKDLPKDNPKLEIAVLRDSLFELVAYSDSDYAGATQDRKSTTGDLLYKRYALTENPTIYVSPINQLWCTASTRTLNNGEIDINATVDGHNKTITEASVRRHLKLVDVDGPTSPVGTQHTPTVIETSPQLQNLSITYRKMRNRTRRMGIRIPQSNDRPERQSNLPNEPPLGEGNISRSGEGSMQLLELMDICTKLSGKVTALENELSSTKFVHNKALITLTKRVKKLEKKLKLKRRSAVVDSSEDEEAREAHDTAGHRMESDDTEVVDFSTASPQNDDDEVTLAETLVNIKMSAIKDKGKAIMQESEPPKKLKKKEMIQIGHDEELAQKLHAEELVKDTARQEQERYHAVQNRSFFIAEVRKNMCIYLKNHRGYKQSHFKGMSYEDIRPIFCKSMDSRNHAFIPKDSKIEKEVIKRSGFDLQQESLKQVEEEIVQQDDVISKQVVKESSRKAEGRLKRKTSKARKDKDKRQKNQDDPEKLTLMEYV